MEDVRPPAIRGRRSSLAWSVVAVLLVLLGSSLLFLGLRSPADPLAAFQPPPITAVPGTSVHRSDPRSTSGTESPTATRIPHSTPIRLVIPSIHVDVRLTKLGLNEDGTVEVPANPAEPGWFDLGPAPGQQGSAVILGHVDSYHGPAIFYLLRLVVPGDRVIVGLRNGSVATFVVTSLMTYPNAAFPNHRVYTRHGFAGLHLVTCGGGFDTVTQHYLGNIVVYSKLVHLSAPDRVAPHTEGRPASN